MPIGVSHSIVKRLEGHYLARPENSALGEAFCSFSFNIMMRDETSCRIPGY